MSRLISPIVPVIETRIDLFMKVCYDMKRFLTNTHPDSSGSMILRRMEIYRTLRREEFQFHLDQLQIPTDIDVTDFLSGLELRIIERELRETSDPEKREYLLKLIRRHEIATHMLESGKDNYYVTDDVVSYIRNLLNEFGDGTEEVKREILTFVSLAIYISINYELDDEKDDEEDFINVLNKMFIRRGVRIKLYTWKQLMTEKRDGVDLRRNACDMVVLMLINNEVRTKLLREKLDDDEWVKYFIYAMIVLSNDPEFNRTSVGRHITHVLNHFFDKILGRDPQFYTSSLTHIVDAMGLYCNDDLIGNNVEEIRMRIRDVLDRFVTYCTAVRLPPLNNIELIEVLEGMEYPIRMWEIRKLEKDRNSEMESRIRTIAREMKEMIIEIIRVHEPPRTHLGHKRPRDSDYDEESSSLSKRFRSM